MSSSIFGLNVPLYDDGVDWNELGSEVCKFVRKVYVPVWLFPLVS